MMAYRMTVLLGRDQQNSAESVRMAVAVTVTVLLVWEVREVTETIQHRRRTMGVPTRMERVSFLQREGTFHRSNNLSEFRTFPPVETYTVMCCIGLNN